MQNSSPTPNPWWISRLICVGTLVMGIGVASGCDGCGERRDPATEDAGTLGPDVDGGANLDAGDDPTPEAPDGGDVPSPDAGTNDEDAGTDPEPSDAGGEPNDFNWQDVFGDAGVPEVLECLPGALPGFSLTEILAAFEFERYQGSSETGVVCGDETCDEDVPCCELCGYAQCAQAEEDGGPATCPAFVRAIQCDGNEDCPNDPAADTCCYTLTGTECRAEADCEFEIPSFGDGGFSLPFPALVDGGGGSGAGDVLDGGFSDAGLQDAGLHDGGVDGDGPDGGLDDDGGLDLDAGGDVDGGADAGVVIAPDAGPEDAGVTPEVDAGAPEFDAGPDEPGPIEEFFSQGVPVCRNTLFDCSPLSLEVCCTSPRIVTLDIGMCLPALLCFNDILP